MMYSYHTIAIYLESFSPTDLHVKKQIWLILIYSFLRSG